MADRLIELCLPRTGNSIRIGITGVPGVGKSTFIESFGLKVIAKGGKLAVMAIDPTSSVSGGSILGDKTRMEKLCLEKDVFIRPSPAGESLGGVARKTREAIFLCEAAGFDYILVETVGVGQSETVVKSMVDFFLLLMLSGAGDELQGIKKGIMEMADAVVITKADGDNLMRSKQAAAQYRNALHLFQPNANGWIPETLVCSAIENSGIEEVREMVERYKQRMLTSGWIEKNRGEQLGFWLEDALNERILDSFYSDDILAKELEKLKRQVLNKSLSPYAAAEQLFQLYHNKK